MIVKSRLVKISCISAFVLAAACSSSSSDDGFTNDDAGGSGDDGGGATDDSGNTGDNGGGGATPDSGGSAVDSGSSTDIPPITSPDGFGAARTACINEINRLRATQSHAVLAVWTGTGIDTCVDSQATSDEKNNSPHQAWGMGPPPAVCDGNAQDECEGQGVTAAGVVKCLDSMWAEQNQTNCTGCAACSGAFFDPKVAGSCPNCDYFGKTGGECGHYVNMSADWLKKVDCGFATGAGNTWSTQNFSQ